MARKTLNVVTIPLASRTTLYYDYTPAEHVSKYTC